MVGLWRCWSGEKATAWARRRCSQWSSPCSLSWSCRDGGKRWSVAFWEERRWLGTCTLQVLHGSHYLHMRDKKDRTNVWNAGRDKCVYSPRSPLCTRIWLAPNEPTQQLHHPYTPTLLPYYKVKLSHLLFFSFSLMTMTSSPLDLLRGGLALAGLLLWMSCSPLAADRHGSEMGAWLDREASWSSNCSSPGQMAGHGIMFTAMLTSKWSLCLWSSPVCAAWSYTWGPENGFNHLGKQKLLPPICSGTVEKLFSWVKRERVGYSFANLIVTFYLIVNIFKR